MFTELYDKNDIFRKKYLENLVNRFSNASLGVEGVDGSLADTMQAMNIYQQTQAIEYAFDIDKNSRLDIGQIIEIEKTVTGDEISKFRTTQAEVYGSKVPRSKPTNIYMDMYTLFDNYYNIWNILDPFLREAYFHIRFLHIHPFEDGNGRTARILLIRNLCANNQIPCVITKEVKKEYCSYIENNDPEGLAEFFRKISLKETNTMINLYKALDDRKLIKSNLMNEEQEKKYNTILQKEIEERKNYVPSLRQMENLTKLFKAASIRGNDNPDINITGIYKTQQIVDKRNNDTAIYFEDSRMMVLYPSNGKNTFKIYANKNQLIYDIDGITVFPEEFEAALKELPTNEKDRWKRR